MNPVVLDQIVRQQEEIAELRQHLSDAIFRKETAIDMQEALRQKLADSQQALRNVYEVWAGSEVFPAGEISREGYLLWLIEHMRDAAKEGMK